MEAVPKLPFLYFQLKTSPEQVDYGSKLKQYIRNQYGEEQEAYSKEIRDLEGLRQSAIRAPRDFTGCSILKKYYSQLHLLQSRFPMKEDEAASVLFSWNDVYSSSGLHRLADIRYEQGCVLYNIGALHSELGAMDSRNTAEGMKMSCTHFQCAAWAFQHLRDNDFPHPSVDLSHSMLTFYINVMMGQAQECILEKSMLDNRKSAIVAKISAQIVDYYKLALKILDDGGKSQETNFPIASKLLKSWRKHLEFKISYHTCVTLLYMGNQAEEWQKMGERVAYMQGALDKLNESSKLAKGLDKDVTDALTFTMDVVGGKLNAASKENEFVYHEKVPALESLPEVKGASLVKGIPFDPNDPEISGPDIFARLVPIEAHEASSMYSEEKAQLLRGITTHINEKDEELKIFLSCLQIDQLKLMPESDRLPQELVDCCAAMSVRPTAVRQLINIMQELSGKFHDVDSLLNEVKDGLEMEINQEKEYQAIAGRRPASMIILEISKELTKYQEAHEKAGESNVTLHKAMDYHIANLNLLSGSLEDLSSRLPSIDALNLGDSPAAKDYQRLLNKVEEMRNQRQSLEILLRDQLQADDITKKLVTTDHQSLKELFKKELQKHEVQLNYIEQNLSAQENILKALTEANARYADSRKALTEIIHKREAMIRGLCSSYEAYEDLNAKCQKGLEFYNKLEASVLKLLQRLRSVCTVQEEERVAILKKEQTKKEIIDPTIAYNGPKLKDFLHFGKSSKLTNRNYPNEVVSSHSDTGAPNLESSEIYVPQAYLSKTQNDSTVFNNLSFPPNLSSEMRLPPVGSEKNELISCKPNIPGPMPTIPSANVNYNSSYNDAVQNNYKVNYRTGEAANNFSVSDYQKPLENYVPPSSAAPSNAAPSNSAWYQKSKQYDYTYRESNINKPEPLGQQNQSFTHSYDLNNSYSIPNEMNSSRSTPGTYNSTMHYQLNSINSNVSYPPASTTVSQVPMNNYSSQVIDPQLSVSRSTDFSTDVQHMGYNQAPIYNPSQITFNAERNTPTTGIYSQPPPPQITGMPTYLHSTQAQVYDGSQSAYYSYSPSQVIPGTSANYMQSYHQVAELTSMPYSSYPQSATPNSYSQMQPGGFAQVLPPINSAPSHLPTPEPLQPKILHQQIPENSPASNQIGSQSANLNISTTSASKPSSNIELLKELDVSNSNTIGTEPSSDRSYKNTEQILMPKIFKVEELIKPKEVSEKVNKPEKTTKDPFSEGFLEKFVLEVERFQKAVEGLTKQSLKGPTPLEQKWKELLDLQERESRKLSISVARCYSMKNKVPDIMPFDNNRVLLSSSSDDYINASYLKDLSKHSAQYIATQAPLPTTYTDFWTMIYEQQTEIVVAILSDAELRGDVYWPKEKGFTMDFSYLSVSLRSVNQKSWGVERVISVTHRESKISRTVMHLQFTGWAPGGIPTTPALFLQFITEVHSYFYEQRNLSRPIVVHCSAGVGRTGVFCLVSTAVQEINAGTGITDLWILAAKMALMRKYTMQDKEHMKFALYSVLYYAEDCLLKRGILIKRASFDDKVSASSTSKSHTRHPSQDFIVPKHNDDQTSENVSQPNTSTATEEIDKISVANRSRTGSAASITSIGSSSSGVASTSNIQSPIHKSNGTPSKSLNLPSSLSNLDPDNFTLDLKLHKTNKITKESFLNPQTGGVKDRQSDPNDPLSQLDPLWSLHNSKP